MNRINRISATLIQLQSKRVVKAKDIADRFSISLRTVYRDIKTLEEAGIPILSEAGIGYSIMNGYKLPPIMFTKEEATALLTAEKFIEKMSDDSTERFYKSAMFKIKAVLRHSEKDLLEDLDKHIEVIPSKNAYKKPEAKILQTILQCITDKQVLSIDYFAGYSEQSTKREVESIGICYYSNHWHLIAFCKLRNEYRDFRVDRIIKTIPEDTFFKKNHPTLKEYLQQISQEKKLEKVIISFDKAVAKYTNNQKYFFGFVQEIEKGDKIEMTFFTPYLDGIARWLLMFTNSFRIHSPKSLISEINKLVDELKINYK
ncbi:MAG: YafY family transcriptional regulator [Colwellia sp.]